MFQGYERKEWFVMLANLKVRTKLVLLTAVAAVSMCVMGIINMAGMEKSYKHSVSSMEEVLYEDYDGQICRLKQSISIS